MSTVIDTRTWLASVDGRPYQLVPIQESEKTVGYVVCTPDDCTEIGHFYTVMPYEVTCEGGYHHDVERLSICLRDQDRPTMPDPRSGAWWARNSN